jgi:hypothetical protein
MGDLSTTRLANYIFNEDHFSTLGRDNKFINDGREIDWYDKSILSSDPRTKETELQVQKILELQQIASNLPNMFTDYKCGIKSLNSTVYTPCGVEVPIKTTPPPKMGVCLPEKRCFQQASEDYEENFFLKESKCKSTKG